MNLRDYCSTTLLVGRSYLDLLCNPWQAELLYASRPKADSNLI